MENLVPSADDIAQMQKDATDSLSEAQQQQLAAYNAAIAAGQQATAEQTEAFNAFTAAQEKAQQEWAQKQMESGAFATAVAGAFAAFTFLF